MAVVFESLIKIDENGEWFIQLIDTVDGRVVLCNNLDEFSQKVEELGSDYGGHIDEVKWSKDENVPESIMNEIRLEMSKHQEKIEKEKAEIGE